MPNWRERETKIERERESFIAVVFELQTNVKKTARRFSNLSPIFKK